ncbi:MAG: hypothetical protein WA842_03960, partial [Croceibacterium sp.]
MTVTFVRKCMAILLLTISIACGSTSAQAQVPPPPVRSTVDENGVDLTSGQVFLPRGGVSIGPEGSKGLSFSQIWVESGWRAAQLPTISGDSYNLTVSFMGQSVAFKSNGSGGYVPYFENGATLNNARTQYVGPDGTQISFYQDSYNYAVVASGLGRPSQVTFPDGTVWTYHYDTSTYSYTPEMPPECYESPLPYELWAYCSSMYGQSQTWYWVRLASITSSTGFQIKLVYQTDTITSINASDPWHQLHKAVALNTAVEYCAPSGTCTFANAWPTATYGANTVTDPENRTTTYSSSGGKLTGVRPPGATVDAMTYTWSGNNVATAQRAGQTWTYGFTATTASVTNPLNHVRTITFDGDDGVVSDSNELGQVTSAQFCGTAEANCPYGLLKKVTAPELNSVEYAYDARGNLTSTTLIGKPGSGVANIVTSATYPTSCTNPKTCNKPLTTTDGLGQVTEYAWNAGNGQLDKVTAPADGAGVRPETRVVYSNIYARYKDSSGTLVQAPTAISLPTSTSRCRVATSANPASCVGSADELVSEITYPSGAAASNAMPLAITTRSGNSAVSATSSIAYDNFARAVTIDGPVPGAGDTSRIRYNMAGQVTGQVAGDAGVGHTRRMATRNTYNAAGQLSMTETGTVADQSDTAWANFEQASRTAIEFDSYGRPVRQKAGAGATDAQITDVVYGDMSRLLCTVQRMNPAAWGSIATSCAPGSAGSYGQDRVTYTQYDALGRVTQSTAGFGTPDAMNQQVAFTTNGQVAAVADGENNLTTYVYDGHDRRVKTRFPLPGKGAGLSSDSDIEEYWWDAAGNLTQLRTRAAAFLTFSYDNLGRMLNKAVPERNGLSPTHTRDVFYGYDLFGDLTYARFDSHSGEGIAFTYDAMGRKTQETQALDGAVRTLGHQYQVGGNQDVLTHPDGNVFETVRDGLGRYFYTKFTGGNPLVHQYRDNLGKVRNFYRWNPAAGAWGAFTGYDFDNVGRLSVWWHDIAGTSDDSWTNLSYSP